MFAGSLVADRCSRVADRAGSPAAGHGVAGGPLATRHAGALVVCLAVDDSGPDPISGSGSKVVGSGSQILGSGSKVVGYGSKIQGPDPRLSDPDPNFRVRIQGCRIRIPNPGSGSKVVGSGSQFQAPDPSLLDPNPRFHGSDPEGAGSVSLPRRQFGCNSLSCNEATHRSEQRRYDLFMYRLGLTLLLATFIINAQPTTNSDPRTA